MIFPPRAECSPIGHMASDQVQNDVAKTVCARFVNLKQATPRHGLVVKFGLDVVNEIVHKRLIRVNRMSRGDAQYLPNCVSFALCGDAEHIRIAKTGFAITFHVLRNMYEIETTTVSHTVDDLLSHARKMYDVVDEDLLRVGISLGQDFPFFSTWTASQDSSDMTTFQISENIMRNSSPDDLWDDFVKSIAGLSKEHAHNRESHRKPEQSDSRALTRMEIEKVVHKYIGVSGGYLGDFSYRTHHDFYVNLELDIDPHKLEGTTRQRFEHILQEATPDVQARILQGILEKYPMDSATIRTKKLRDEIVGWIGRLSTGAVVTVTPLRVTSAVVERALLDAEKLMASTGATSGVDRAHTALHGYLLQVCSDSNISMGEEPNLSQLFKALRQKHAAFKELGARSDDVAKLLGAMATIVDVLNPLRNKASVAHPNEQLLAEPEALLVINSVRTMLNYLDSKLHVK